MTEMEMDYAGQIVDYSLSKVRHFVNHEDMVNSFWNEYFQSCTMSTPETGLEMPHENEYFSDINIWTNGFGGSDAS